VDRRQPGGDMIGRLIILGATGDLATRHLLPALTQLRGGGGLPSRLRVVGIGREALTGDDYRSLVATSLAAHAPDVSEVDSAALVADLDYLRADISDEVDLSGVLAPGPVVAHLALPPAVYPAAVLALKRGGLKPGSRIVVEKPFGEDAASARKLSRLLHTAVGEADVFRVDHFLYHQAVQDLMALRLGNSIIEPLWNREHVASVEITWEETSGVGGRTEFFDRTGALRDMVQSHLLQLLALVAMEVPAALDEHHLREEKATVLRRTAELTPAQVAALTARGRYTAGKVRGETLRSYVEEPGVDPSRDTETYAFLQLSVDTGRWRDVPFVLRTGKALGRQRRRVALHFRAPRRSALPVAPAVLSFDMAPDSMTLSLHVTGPSGLPEVQPVELAVARAEQALRPSARMLRDVLMGDSTFVLRDDEIDESWRIVDSVLATWRLGMPMLQDYPAGSTGPVCP
jgi:glucose-6-phosphate 1-dehydrogenase